MSHIQSLVIALKDHLTDQDAPAPIITDTKITLPAYFDGRFSWCEASAEIITVDDHTYWLVINQELINGSVAISDLTNYERVAALLIQY